MADAEEDATPVRRALLSASDKTGLIDFARRLAAAGVELLSTGGTARALTAAGLDVTEVSAHTDFPEIMDGRVKTLHPRIHGGILGRRDRDAAVMAEHGIAPIDLVVANLYPFREAVARPGVGRDEAVEHIDIGGPAMVRAAAKNHAWVGVVTDPGDYAAVAAEIEAGGLSPATRRYLARAAFEHTADYDRAIADWLSAADAAPGADDPEAAFPERLAFSVQRHTALRYGENPHQRAAFYAFAEDVPASVTAARLHQGKALSFNNIADADTALACVRQFPEPACVIVKHANPCGVAIGADAAAAYEGAYATDPVSAFGGIIAFNRPLSAALADTLIERQFIEVIVAPEIPADALAVLERRPNIRVLATGADAAPATGWDIRSVGGGLLVQERDDAGADGDWRVVTSSAPDDAVAADLRFAWRVAATVKSNAIVYAAGGRTIGIGAGQMSRVDSARLAGLKAGDAGLDTAGAVMASDAFLPFRDGLDTAAAAGIRAVVQPGGSVRDEEVIAAADELGLAMVFTGRRHFRH